MPVSTIDIAWTAGFLEGEGCFGIERLKTRRGGETAIIRLSAGQNQKEPLLRLQALYGGSVLLVKRNTPTFGVAPHYTWRLSTTKSVPLMMTIYALMSPKRREQIERCLNQWKSHKTYKLCALMTNVGRGDDGRFIGRVEQLGSSSGS